MIIRKIKIKKFRGFENQECELGTELTAIAGQNGTQKTTILGMLIQPFSISQPDNPMRGEKPLSGGSFRSTFEDSFKFSTVHDKAKNHIWTIEYKLNKHDDIINAHTLISINRDQKSKNIRFYKKKLNSDTADKRQGAGYLQHPIIYLSLRRLMPIGEDLDIKEDDFILTNEEVKLYKKWHNEILIITERHSLDPSVLKSKTKKNTLGNNTDYYNWETNSAGQDNIGKIFLAVLTFKRLKEKYNEEYKGGILAIDEIDSTLYPASQIKLIKSLCKYAKELSIQIIFTTHSLTILKHISDTSKNHNQIKIVYLEKKNNKINITNGVSYKYIENNLNVTINEIEKPNKIDVYLEDEEARYFFKWLISRKYLNRVNINNNNFGCDELIKLSMRKVPSFIKPNSIIILDGDVLNDISKMKKIKNLNNYLLLPSNKSIEQLLSEFLFLKDEEDEFWDFNRQYTKQYCFKEYSYEDIQIKRDISKLWFKQNKIHWGRGCSKVFNSWEIDNGVLIDDFINNFVKMYNDFAFKLGYDKIE